MCFFTIVDRDQLLTIVDHFTRSFSNDRRSSIILHDHFQTIVDRDQDHDRDLDRRSTIEDRDRAHHCLLGIYIYIKYFFEVHKYMVKFLCSCCVSYNILILNIYYIYCISIFAKAAYSSDIMIFCRGCSTVIISITLLA